MLEQIHVGTVAVDNICFWQRSHELLAANTAVVNQFYANMVADQPFCEFCSKLSSTYKHNRMYRLTYQVNTGKELCHFILISDKAYCVSRL